MTKRASDMQQDRSESCQPSENARAIGTSPLPACYKCSRRTGRLVDLELLHDMGGMPLQDERGAMVTCTMAKDGRCSGSDEKQAWSRSMRPGCSMSGSTGRRLSSATAIATCTGGQGMA